MNGTTPVPAPTVPAWAQIEQLMAQLDATLPKVKIGTSLVTPSITPDQFDSLTASW